MGRIPRWRLGVGIFHVYNRSINMLPILNNDEEKDRFSEILKAKLSTHDLNVYHYDLQIFRSDATVIGDDNFKGKVLTYKENFYVVG